MHFDFVDPHCEHGTRDDINNVWRDDRSLSSSLRVCVSLSVALIILRYAREFFFLNGVNAFHILLSYFTDNTRNFVRYREDVSASSLFYYWRLATG